MLIECTATSSTTHSACDTSKTRQNTKVARKTMTALASAYSTNFFGSEDSGEGLGDCVTVIDLGETSQSIGRVADTLNKDSLSWRFAAHHQWSTETSIYAYYSRGFGVQPTIGNPFFGVGISPMNITF